MPDRFMAWALLIAVIIAVGALGLWLVLDLIEWIARERREDGE
jgi:hypothetical protein